MSEIQKYMRNSAMHITPRIVENLLRKLPLLKAEFTQIQAPRYPHLVDQLEFLANAVEDFAEGAYKDLPYTAIAGAAFALIYSHRIVEIIPDFVTDFGFSDDSAIVRCVLMDHEKSFAKYALDMGFNWKGITSQP
jgi:uncharacterized membrane protein YkvA (DUF1232 family)